MRMCVLIYGGSIDVVTVVIITGSNDSKSNNNLALCNGKADKATAATDHDVGKLFFMGKNIRPSGPYCTRLNDFMLQLLLHQVRRGEPFVFVLPFHSTTQLLESVVISFVLAYICRLNSYLLHSVHRWKGAHSQKSAFDPQIKIFRCF